MDLASSTKHSLTDVLESPQKLDLMGKFLPHVDLGALTRQSVSNFAPLSFQVNVFQCGGIVIGCYFFHKLMDVASLSIFFQYWVVVASKRYNDLVEPDFGATVASFPPCVLPAKVGSESGDGMDVGGVSNDSGGGSGKVVDGGHGAAGAGIGSGAGAGADKEKDFAKLWFRFNSIKVACRSFIFNNKSVKELKAKAVSEALPNPTSFEVVAGFVWQQIMSATSDKQSAPTVLSFSANVRSNTNPPLPKAAVGNAIASLHVCGEKYDEQLPYYVKQIHATLSTVSKKVKIMQGKNAAEMLAARNAGLQGYGNDKKATSYAHLSSWCKLGLYDVDFGFGKPTKVIPIGNVYPFLRNSFKFLEYRDDSNGAGIEVWLFMEEKEMKIIEAETKIFDFASPN